MITAPADDAASPVASHGLGETVLKKLWQAGSNGVTTTQFGCDTRKSRAQLDRTLLELIDQNKVTRIDAGRRTSYFLRQFAPSLESVRRKVEQKAREARGALVSKEGLTLDLLPAERPFLSQALVSLLAEKALIKLSHFASAGARQWDFYMHTSGLRELVAATFPEDHDSGPASAFTPKNLLEAYQALVLRNGFPDVEIFEIHEHLGLPLPVLKAQILREHEAGRAVLSFGDWSLASAEIRSGMIEINGDRYLRVRFQG